MIPVEIIQVPALGHLPTAKVATQWFDTDIACWVIARFIDPPAFTPDCTLGLFHELRHYHGKNYPDKHRLRIVINDDNHYWELVPAWRTGVMVAMERRCLPETITRRLTQKTKISL